MAEANHHQHPRRLLEEVAVVPMLEAGSLLLEAAAPQMAEAASGRHLQAHQSGAEGSSRVATATAAVAVRVSEAGAVAAAVEVER